MKIEVGKRYRTRKGDVVLIEKDDNHSTYPMVGDDGISYMRDGKYHRYAEFSSRDLVECLGEFKTDDIVEYKYGHDRWAEARYIGATTEGKHLIQKKSNLFYCINVSAQIYEGIVYMVDEVRSKTTITELTLDEVAEKFGVNVNQLKIKK